MKRTKLKSVIESLVRDTVINKLIGEGHPLGGVKNDHDFDDGREPVMKAVNIGENNERPCNCGSGLPSYWQNDGQGIPLCRVCSKCKAEKLKKYRPEILKPYTQHDVDEPIEPEEFEEGAEQGDYLGKDYFDRKKELETQIASLTQALKDKRYFGRVEEIQGYLAKLQKELIQLNLKIKSLITYTNDRRNPQRNQIYAREEILPSGKYKDDMESGVAVKKLHNLDEAPASKQKFIYPEDFKKSKNYIRVLKKPETGEFVVYWYENGRKNEDKSYFTDDAADAWNTFAVMKMDVDKANSSKVTENEFDGYKAPKHNAKISPQEQKDADEIAKKIWGNELKNITFHSKSLDGKTKYFKVDTNSTYFRWLSQNGQSQWHYTDDGGIRSKWVPFTDNVNEMTGTGAVAGYSTPYAFSKKGGSKRALDVTTKMGYKKVKDID